MVDQQEREQEVSYLAEMTSKVSFVFVSGISCAVLGYIALMIANRFIGIESYGMVAFGLSFVGLFFFLSDLGFTNAHVKRISEGGDEESLLPAFATIKMILTGLMAVVVLFAFWLYEQLGGGYGNPTIKNLTHVVLIYYVLLSLGQIFVSNYNAKRDAIRTQSAILAEVTCRCLATIGVALLGWGALGLSLTWMIAGAGFFFVAISLYRGPRLQFPTLGQFRSVFRSYFRFALPLSFLFGFSAGGTYFDKILIQYFFESREVALLFGSQRLSAIFTAMASAVSIMLFPLLSEVRADLSVDRTSQLASRSTFYLSLAIFPMAFFAFVLAGPILGIYISSAYYAADNVFRLLILGSIFNLLAVPYASLLLGLGRPGDVARIGITIASVIIILNLILIPPSGFLPFSMGLGIHGAALSILIAGCVNVMLAVFVVSRTASLSIPTKLPAIALLSAATSSVVLILYSLFGASRFYDILGYFAVQVGLFYPLAVLLGIVTRDEIRRLLKIFSPRAFLKFLRS